MMKKFLAKNFLTKKRAKKNFHSKNALKLYNKNNYFTIGISNVI